MFLRIQHLTQFSYNRPVFLEPMTIRLRPRSDCWQKLHHYLIEVDPLPKGRADFVDLDGNSISSLWFEKSCSSLELTTSSFLETFKENPFDFILTDPEFFELPVRVSEDYKMGLEPYLARNSPSSQVDDFSLQIAQQVNSNTTLFLGTLCSRIHESIERVLRLTGDPLSAEEVLIGGKGACRDITVLFMDACRSVGIPARFTSGYYFGDDDFSARELHAWAEVYLPGGGWRGYDPTIGLAVSNGHIAVASAWNPLLASPTTGTYRGTGIDSSIDFRIQMESASSLEDLVHS